MVRLTKMLKDQVSNMNSTIWKNSVVTAMKIAIK